MFSKKPVVRRIAWISLLPQLLVMVIFITISKILFAQSVFAFDIGLLSYVMSSILLRHLVPRNHRKGMRLYKAGDYTQAIHEFEKSYDFFTKYAWVDKYRYMVLLSASRMSYTEMALVNAAFCYTQVGDGRKAREYYNKALQQFPDSELAKAALRMMDSLADHSAEGEDDRTRGTKDWKEQGNHS